MKPQTAAYVDKARELVSQGDTMMDVRLIEAARRFVDCVAALIPPNAHTPDA